MRIAGIETLAAWVAAEQGWRPEHVRQMKENGERRDVRLKRPIPLYFAYITAWATPDGAIHFRRDIYRKDGKDWALVARKLEEVVAVLPNRIDAAVELGNAYLRLGDGAHAARAYRRPLEQKETPIDADFARRLRAQVALVEAAADPSKVAPMRNPWLE